MSTKDDKTSSASSSATGSGVGAPLSTSDENRIALTLIWRLSNNQHRDLVPKYLHVDMKLEKAGDYVYFHEIIRVDRTKTISDLAKEIKLQSRLVSVMDEYELCFMIHDSDVEKYMLVSLSPWVVISDIVMSHFTSNKGTQLYDEIYLIDKSAGSIEFERMS
jgi:hypothetical protein